MAMVVEGLPLSGYNTYQNFTMDKEQFGNRKDTPDRENMEGPTSPIDVTKELRPASALARGVQITEFAESRVNPTPLLLEESDILLEQYLSPGKLQLLTGVDNLETVNSLELKVNSRETSLGNFGSLLPNLVELKLSGSCISSVRDLGSSLRKLRILWLTRCGLEELDGISSMLNLSELYLEYNELSDLSPLSMLEHLEILDLEGNNIDDITQVQYLSLCPKLRRLALDGNPICVCPTPTDDQPNYDYRQTIKKMVPSLLVLDDERLDDAPSSFSKNNVFDEDWAYLEELQKDAFLQNESLNDLESMGADQNYGDRPPTAALRPATSYRPGSALRPSSGYRPMSASRRPSTMSGPSTPARPKTGAIRPVSSDATDGLEVVSDLTMGSVICGNPSKALRQRRKGGADCKEEIQKGLSKLMQKGAIFSHSAESEDEPLKTEDEMNTILEELQSWKVEHEERMKVILKSKEAQVLVVDHDEAEDIEDSGDDSDLDLPQETIDYRPPASQHRHVADLRLKAGKDIHVPMQEYSPKEDGVTYPQSKLSSAISAYAEAPTQKISRDHSRSFSEKSSEDDDFSYIDSREFHDRPPSSISQAHHNSKQSSYSDGGTKDSWPPSEGSAPPRSRSRGQGDASLGPLRAPSPTSAQIINSLRSRQNELLTSPRTRRLRVGPTGLPQSSQQPVIRTGVGLAPARPGLMPTSSRPSSSRANVALLPSQPRIARQVPEAPSLYPHPPKHS